MLKAKYLQVAILAVTIAVTLETISHHKGGEFTFELADSAKECYHQEINSGIKSTIEFQVVTGGHYDVDLTIQDPRNQIIYQGVKKQFDTYTWTAANSGVHTFCFSNEFSTFSHKLIYFDLQVGEEDPLPGTSDHVTAMTKMEQSSANIHENLNTVSEAQTHYRLNEAKGRKRAEDLNNRVMHWSIGQSCIIFVITVGQVMVLKNFFTDKQNTIRT